MEGDTIMNDHQDAAAPGRNLVLYVYGAFGICLVSSFLPLLEAAIVSIFLLAAVLIAAYIIRAKSEEGSLPENHMTFIIRTIWIAGIISIVSISSGCAFMLMDIDNAPLGPCIDQILGLDPAQAQGMSTLALYQMFGPCLDEFIKVNFMVLIISAAIAGAPILVYLLYRYIKGLSRAIKGYRIANQKSWL